MSRTLEQIIDDIKLQFKDTTLQNAANNKGNLYSLIRGMALTCFNQEQIIQQIIDSKMLTSVVGFQLDAYANNYGIIRRQGTSSFGSIILKSTLDLLIPSGTLLQNVNGTLTFQTIKSVNVPNNKEISVQIVSLSKSFDANLSSQTELICPSYPQLKVYVGSFTDISGVIFGDLRGGSDSEDDNSLKNRLSIYLNNKGLVTLPSIKALIQNYVSDAYFVEGRPAAGYTTLYVNTSDQLTIDLLINQLQDIKPIGVIIIVKPIQYEFIDLQIEVLINSNVNESITIINTNIKKAINVYFSKLKVGEQLIINELSSFISSYTGYFIKIIKPINNYSPYINEYLLTPREVSINVKSK